MSTTATQLTAAQATSTGLPPAGTWEIDKAHASIEFVARHLMVSKVRGHFGSFEGTIHIGDGADESWAEATIDTSSIHTNMVQRDEHLRSPDFLDVEKFPEMKFRTTSAQSKGKGRWVVYGDLTIKDVTREIELDGEFLGTTTGPAGEVAFFEATGEIDREAFGITWNMALEGGGWLVSKKVQLEIHAEAIKKA